jgi:hypothetical protein
VSAARNVRVPARLNYAALDSDVAPELRATIACRIGLINLDPLVECGSFGAIAHLMSNGSSAFPNLADPLADYVEHIHPAHDDVSSYNRERSATARMLEICSPRRLLRGGGVIELAQIASACLAVPTISLRTGLACSAADSRGSRQVYPSIEEWPFLARELTLFAREQSCPIAVAFAAYVGVIHAHFLGDGNKRIARIIMNGLLAESGMPAVYLTSRIAVTELAAAEVIKVRRVIHGGDWASLLRFYADIALLFRSVQQIAPGMADGSFSLPVGQCRPVGLGCADHLRQATRRP